MRLVGYNDLQERSAYQPTIHKQGNRYIAYIGHHGGTEAVPKPMNPMTGQDEFNGTSIVDVTDPKNPKYLKHIPGAGRLGRAGRRADGARLRRQDAAEGRSEQGLSAAHLRRPGPRNLGRDRAGRPDARLARELGPQGHAQELVGMRHRHRLPRLRRAGLARPAHDRGVRPQRSGASRENPRLRPGRAAAGRDRGGARPTCTA